MATTRSALNLLANDVCASMSRCGNVHTAGLLFLVAVAVAARGGARVVVADVMFDSVDAVDGTARCTVVVLMFACIGRRMAAGAAKSLLAPVGKSRRFSC